MLTLFDSRLSGNAYKVRLLLSNLGIPFRRVTLNLAQGEAKTTEMLARNPLGRVPVLQLEDGTTLWESNAILCFLARGSPLLPELALDNARVLQWLMFEQFDLARNLARPRFLIHITGQREAFAAQIADCHAAGYRALTVMDRHLERQTFFVCGRYTVADIALYGYTHVAHQGEYDMARFPAVQTWLHRVEAQPAYIPL